MTATNKCYPDSAGDAPGPAAAKAAAPSTRADCVLCGKPTEHPASQPGATLCPVCEWQEAQRIACPG